MTSKRPFVGERVRLGDIASVKAGNVAPKKEDFSEEGAPFIRAGSLSSLLRGESLDSLEKLSDSVAQRLGMKLFPAGTVVFAKSGMSCLKGYVYTLPRDCYVVSHLACITPHTGFSKYLEHFFAYNKPNRLIQNPSFPSIKLSRISDIELPLLDRRSMDYQVTCLELVQKQRHEADAIENKLDELVKSRFVEMFGAESWPSRPIHELATDIRYGTSKKATNEGKYTYLRMNNMTDDGKLDFNDTKRITLSGTELEKCLVRNGDVLFNRTNSREKVGKTAVFESDQPMVIAGYIIRVRLGSELRSRYFAAYMNLPHVKKMLQAMAKGAVHQANINARQLGAIDIPVPPVPLQDEFIDFTRYIDKLRTETQRQKQDLQTLYDSLAQEYFAM